jgi:hypothetical protein
MLAHQLGFPLPNGVAYGIWNWKKLWKECGSPGAVDSSQISSTGAATGVTTGALASAGGHGIPR